MADRTLHSRNCGRNNEDSEEDSQRQQVNEAVMVKESGHCNCDFKIKWHNLVEPKNLPGRREQANKKLLGLYRRVVKTLLIYKRDLDMVLRAVDKNEQLDICKILDWPEARFISY